MLVELVHVRFEDAASDLQGLKATLQSSSMAAVVVDDTVDWRTIRSVATVIAFSRVPVVASFGARSGEVHDLVDLISLRDRENGPITTCEDGELADFIFNITFTYRGLLDPHDQTRKTVVCYISTNRTVPEALGLAVEQMQATTWTLRLHNGL